MASLQPAAFSRVQLVDGRTGWTLADYCVQFVPRFFFVRGFARRLPPEVLDMYLAPFSNRARRADTVIAPRQLVAAPAYLLEVEANLANIAQRPTLIVWGLKDFAFRDAERKRFEQLFVNHKTILIKDASHFLQEDAGDEIAAAIRVFTNRSERGSGGLASEPDAAGR